MTLTTTSQFNPGTYSVDIQVVTTVDSTAVAWDTASTSATVSDADLTVPAFTLTNSGVSIDRSFKYGRKL